jgi:hypothetical protein
VEEIIRFVFKKFCSIEELDIRPHLGDVSSTYIAAIERVLGQLDEEETRCYHLVQLLISHTSFRYERVVSFTTQTKLLQKIEQHLTSISGRENESNEKARYHDAAICQDCQKQFAHTSGDKTCMLCPSTLSPMCLSCTEYCSLCDSQICSNCLDEEEACLDGRCYSSVKNMRTLISVSAVGSRNVTSI